MRLGLRTTHAGLPPMRRDKSSSVANSSIPPTKSVVECMSGGRGTKLYRTPPTSCSTRSASRKGKRPRAVEVQEDVCRPGFGFWFVGLVQCRDGG